MAVASNNSDLTEPDEAEFKNLFRTGKYDVLLKRISSYPHHPVTEYWKGETLLKLGNYDESIQIITDFLDGYNSLNHLSMMQEEFLGRFLFLSGKYHQVSGNLDKAIQDLKTARDIFEKLNITDRIVQVIIQLSSILYGQGEIDRAQQSMKFAETLLTEVNDPRIKGQLLLNLGLLTGVDTSFNSEMVYFRKALVLFEEENDLEGITRVLNNIGGTYWYAGDLLQAKEYYTKSLEMATKINHNRLTVTAMFNLGVLYCDLQDYEKSEKYYNETLKLYSKFNSPVDLSQFYHYFIELYINTENRTKAYHWLETLKILSKKNRYKRIILRYRYSKAIIAKSFLRHSEKMKQIKKFKILIESNDYDIDILVRSIKHLIELLIIEYQNGKDKNVHGEIQEYLVKLFDTAFSQNMKREIVFSMVLQSKLALIDQNIEQVYVHLNNAKNYVEVHNLDHFSHWIEQEFITLKNILDSWNKVLSNSSIMEQIEKLNILDYLTSVSKFTNSIPPDNLD